MFQIIVDDIDALEYLEVSAPASTFLDMLPHKKAFRLLESMIPLLEACAVPDEALAPLIKHWPSGHVANVLNFFRFVCHFNSTLILASYVRKKASNSAFLLKVENYEVKCDAARAWQCWQRRP